MVEGDVEQQVGCQLILADVSRQDCGRNLCSHALVGDALELREHPLDSTRRNFSAIGQRPSILIGHACDDQGRWQFGHSKIRFSGSLVKAWASGAPCPAAAPGPRGLAGMTCATSPCFIGWPTR